MLRASVEAKGEAIDPRAVLSGPSARSAELAAAVPHAQLLSALAEAVVGRDDTALTGAREALLAAAGPECFVDAVAVAGNFERMVRIADATGIPLDAPVAALASDLREEFGLAAYRSAANTPAPGAVARLGGRLARPLIGLALRVGGRLRRG
jgi:hypothetical protein